MYSLTDWKTRFPKIPQGGPFWCIPASIENMLRYAGFSALSQQDLVLGYCRRFGEDALLKIVSHTPFQAAPVSIRGLNDAAIIQLFQIVRHGLRIGEDNYSIKTVELLYRSKRATEVATAIDSIVQYSRWIESKQARSWQNSTILKRIRDYNEDDCKSTAELLQWLRKVAAKHKIVSACHVATLNPPTSMHRSRHTIILSTN